MDDRGELRIGAAHIAEEFLDVEATVEKDCEYIREAGELGLDLLVFPEYHVPSAPNWWEFSPDYSFEEYYVELLKNAVTVPGPAVEQLSTAAAEAGCVVVVGINLKEPNGHTLYNAQLVLDADGTVLGTRRKLVPTKSERMVHAGGTGRDVRVFETAIGTVGGLMCGEHLNHLLAFSLMAEGQEFHAASWPQYSSKYTRDDIERIIGVRTRFHAEAAKVPTALAMGTVTEELAEAIGAPELTTYPSMSAVISPKGEYLAGPEWDGEGIVHASIDPEQRLWEKSHHDLVGHYNRFDIFDLRINDASREPITRVSEEDR